MQLSKTEEQLMQYLWKRKKADTIWKKELEIRRHLLLQKNSKMK